MRNPKNSIEVSGLTATTPRIIDAFILNLFGTERCMTHIEVFTVSHHQRAPVAKPSTHLLFDARSFPCGKSFSRRIIIRRLLSATMSAISQFVYRAVLRGLRRPSERVTLMVLNVALAFSFEFCDEIHEFLDTLAVFIREKKVRNDGPGAHAVQRRPSRKRPCRGGGFLH